MHKAILLLRKIPKGKVTTYGELARVTKSSPRAIGQVMKNNPDSSTYPCYKVIKSDGSLGGYCGTMNSRKKIALLARDGIIFKKGKLDLKKYLHKF